MTSPLRRLASSPPRLTSSSTRTHRNKRPQPPPPRTPTIKPYKPHKPRLSRLLPGRHRRRHLASQRSAPRCHADGASARADGRERGSL
ncbi:hypothetical protein GQ602_001172 [Ophiocordyceps camponoti-floridani]|uniref:Uncharacterized protein n=1 Tax=Ophiocordyceps camponoti-floridani TaxID=2030778 RepID=A0A8H4VGY8_9HYPO|nr:hypothetical protein GQ602_001172 [Ophiocordyceps camponoti-floridani]